jgi:hypothetical protein
MGLGVIVQNLADFQISSDGTNVSTGVLNLEAYPTK